MKSKGSDTLESFLSKVAFQGDFRKKTCTCVIKTFASFLLSKETFTIRTCSILESFFRKLLSKATFERKLSKENFLVCHYLNQIDSSLYSSSSLRLGEKCCRIPMQVAAVRRAVFDTCYWFSRVFVWVVDILSREDRRHQSDSSFWLAPAQRT